MMGEPPVSVCSHFCNIKRLTDTMLVRAYTYVSVATGISPDDGGISHVPHRLHCNTALQARDGMLKRLGDAGCSAKRPVQMRKRGASTKCCRRFGTAAAGTSYLLHPERSKEATDGMAIIWKSG